MNEMTKMPVDRPANDKNAKAEANPAKANQIESVCVYCGSGKGVDSAYAIAARKLGKTLADNGIRLIYGGGSLGLMGEVARAALGAGGKVTGIIPEFLGSREHMLKDVDELIVVENMHVRKQLMFDRADAFVALPGGIGTLEELVEQLTWSQLGRHSKPIVVANINGFWDPFLNLLDHMKAETFIRAGLDVRFTVVNNAEDILPAIKPHAETERTSDDSISRRF
ncbi:MAG: TIGR00730 family Rossman fold protein [Hyphomicrobium sp.]|uniref:LOG family protein n=1 Tax=Hyphomicrobium sp. TaxID=82 RepID=UPI0039E363D8